MDREKQLLSAIANAQGILEVNDPQMMRFIMDEIERFVRENKISQVVADQLKHLPTNRLVPCFDAVQAILRSQHSAS